MGKDSNRSIRILIDHSPAMKSATELKQKIQDLEAELQRLAAAGEQDTAGYKKKEKALKDLNIKYQKYQDELTKTERVLKNLSGATEKELLDIKRKLIKVLKDATRGSTEYKAAQEALVKVNRELTLVERERNGHLKESSSLMSRAANNFNKYFGLVSSGIVAVTGISLAFRGIAEDVAQLDDSYADVMKTTGMTREQVLDLNEEFKKMDTRTARDELNMLGRDAGKLGLTGKKDILDFIQAGNQINVALGEDLGEGAIKNIGKMTDVYALSTKELEKMDLKGKMLAIGSAINELGQSSTASEPYMVNFTQRLGGVASQAGISIQNILGYASALDQSGQAVEMSATALQKFIMKLMGEPAKFAKMAGLELGKFNKLLKEDTNQAIKEVLTALSNKGGFQQLIPIFKDMGLDGARAVGVLSALATNIKKVDEAQALSNKAFAEGTSITDEYNIKNENLQAQLEKSRKAFRDASLELGEKLNPIMLKSTKATTYLIKLLPGLLNWMERNKVAILSIISAITTYLVVSNASIAAKKMQVFWNTKILESTAILTLKEKLHAAAVARSALVTYAKGLAHDVLAKKITFAYAANELFRMSMMKMPWGIVLALIAAVGVALYNYTKRIKEAATSAQKLANVNKEVNESIASEKAELNMLLSIARNEKISKDERLKAIKRLNEISPTYLGNLNLENINTQKATESIKAYTEELIKNAKAKSIQSKVENLYSKKNENDLEIDQLNKQLELNQLANAAGQQNATLGDDKRKKRIKELEAENAQIEENVNTYTSFYEKTYQVKQQSNENNAALRKVDLDNNKKYLSELEQQFADSYADVNKSKPDFYPESAKVMDNAQLAMLGQKVEKQRELVNEQETSLKLEAKKAEFMAMTEKQLRAYMASNKDYLDLAGSVLNQRFPVNNIEPDEKELKKQLKEKKTYLETQETLLDTALKEELQLLKANKIEQSQTEEEYNILVAEKQKEYYDKRIKLYEDFKKKEKITNKKLSAEVDGKITDNKGKKQDADITIDNIRLSALKKQRDKELAFSEAAKMGQIKHLQELNLSEEQYAARMEIIELTAAQRRVAINKEYGDKLNETEIANGKIKEDAVTESNTAILQSEIQAANQRIAIEKKMRETNKSVRNQYGIFTKEERLNEEIAIQDALLKAKLISAETHQKAVLAIYKKYEDETLQVKEQYGIASMQELYDAEMAALKLKHEQGYLSEEEYEDAVFRMRMAHAAEWVEKQKHWLDKGSNMVSALQSAETANLDAEYDARIAAAQGNAEETERLETEKAQKKLDIEKKYADVQFAIKASEIIANTAVAIMTGYAQLGPLAGSIAGAMIGVTGAAQLVAANAERQRVKSMTLKGSSSGGFSGAITTKQRAEGKYDVIGEQDGKTYRNVPFVGDAQTGIVSQPVLVGERGAELIVSHPDMIALQRHINYPLIIQAISDVRSGTIPQRASGKYDSIPDKTTAPANVPDPVMEEMLQLLKYLKNNPIKANAYLGMSELDAEMKKYLQDQQRFTKKDS